MKQEVYWYWLCNRKILGAVKLRRLVEAFGSPEAIFQGKEAAWIARGGLKEAEAWQLTAAKAELRKEEEEWERHKERGIYMVTYRDENFPRRLSKIAAPPACLFVKGELPKEEKKTVAIVGARGCTDYGVTVTEEIAESLGRAGCWVISGLAYGIDGAAHRGALKGGGKTCAVLGCGVDICYPREHFSLYEEIERQGGCMMSEYTPGTSPLPKHFPIRNRLISGLADAVLVMEARKKSGSLITVERALEQGKEIFALPGRLEDPLSVGCLELIRDGAHVLMGARDVLEILGIAPEHFEKKEQETKLPLAEDEKLVYSAIACTQKHLDEILGEVPMTNSQVHGALLALELGGWIRQTAKNYYIRTQR